MLSSQAIFFLVDVVTIVDINITFFYLYLYITLFY